LADDGHAVCVDTMLGQTMAELATRESGPEWVPGNSVRVPGFKFPGY